MIGIYLIKNLVNDKKYVGSSVQVKTRIAVHKCLLKQGKSHNSYLQNAWNKYSEENFAFEILECVLDESILKQREQYWIDKYDSFNNGYNLEPFAERPIHSAETREKLSKKLTGRKFSNITKKRMSKAWRNRVITYEQKRKTSINSKNKKLSDMDVVFIRNFHGIPLQDIADTFHVALKTIQNIRSGINRKVYYGN